MCNFVCPIYFNLPSTAMVPIVVSEELLSFMIRQTKVRPRDVSKK